MPCNCDHMEPNADEIRLSQIACIVDELKSGRIKIHQKSYWEGYHPDVYSQTYDKYNINAVSKKDYENKALDLIIPVLQDLTPEQLSKFSLELQIWWRDFQSAGKLKQREKTIQDKAEKNRIRAKALAKLTEEEKQALGLK